MNYANAIGSTEPQRAESTLEGAVSSLARGHEELRHALHNLAERLNSVLQPEAPPTAGDKAARLTQAEPPRSQIVANLHGERNVVEGLTNFVNSLSARLDT